MHSIIITNKKICNVHIIVVNFPKQLCHKNYDNRDVSGPI